MKKILFIVLTICSLGLLGACDENEYMLDDITTITPKIEIPEDALLLQGNNGETVTLKAALSNPAGIETVELVCDAWGLDERIEVNASSYELNREVTVPVSAVTGLYVVKVTLNSKNQLTLTKEINVLVGMKDEVAPTFVLSSDTELQYKASFDIVLKLTDNVGLKSLKIWSDEEASVLDSIELEGLQNYDYTKTVTLPASYRNKTIAIQMALTDLVGNVTTNSDAPFVFKVNVLPETLYLVGGATEAGWTETAAIPFTKVGEGKFEILARLKTDGYGFKFIAERDWDHGVWGLEEEITEPLPSEYQGALYEGTDSKNIPPVATEGMYKIEVDLDASTFSIKPNKIPEQLYLVGGSCIADWTPANGILFEKRAEGLFRNYSYLVAAGGGIKFLGQTTDWGPDNWGKGATENSLLFDSQTNIDMPEGDGFYSIDVDFNAYSYTLTKQVWGIIGDATANGWDNITPMTLEPMDKGSYKWVLKNTPVLAGGLKFKTDASNWDYNFGGTGLSGEAVSDGGNITITEAGNYDIELDLTPGNYTYSIVKK
ncbi:MULTISPECIES: SusF/SusE family outer membrane protein [unclassified Bacteroides]|jgi:hypothetical protein|uniref:SusF/SusE family outer membrane protein n=1 Tax=unclassified Bacteroides TaxID=2646097 RepID=UPI000E9FF49C|nr:MULTISPECIES: SusF/SusE family outer membrane protein [unclassified Bacteroides]RGN51273.1 SusF/SusE family outer membrane protein [Bacteroides sp. OM05-12]RHR78612.1 SusF/SusE family outer membrane protein [Bacteroides sp. AF16-49]